MPVAAVGTAAQQAGGCQAAIGHEQLQGGQQEAELLVRWQAVGSQRPARQPARRGAHRPLRALPRMEHPRAAGPLLMDAQEMEVWVEGGVWGGKGLTVDG